MLKNRHLFKTALPIWLITFVILFILPMFYRAGSKLLAENSSSVPLCINEICSANPGTPVPDGTTYEDYIELYNYGNDAVSLDGLYLSDDADEPLKAALPDITVPSGGFLVIYAVGAEGSAPEGCVSVPFAIKGGESVFLSMASPSGAADSTAVTIDCVSVPSSSSACSVYAASTDGGDIFCEMEPSPGESNASASMLLEEPVILTGSGFYEDSVTVEISAGEGLEIRYTLDGSDPDADSLLYTEPIVLTDPSQNENVYSSYDDITSEIYWYEVPDTPVDKACVLRAAAFDSDGNSSNTVTATYFIDFDEKEGYEDAVIISIATDPDNLFSDEDGIYVRGSIYEDAVSSGLVDRDDSWSHLIGYTNYYNDGRDSERTASIQLFSKDGTLSIDQTAGIRVRGGESRNFPQKSFTLYARNCYGSDSFDTDLFGTDISYSSLILNNSMRLKKVVFFSLVDDRSAAVQQYVPVQVFLNGEYWGMYYLMEKYTSEYVSGYYGVDGDDVLIINDSHEVKEGADSDLSRYQELIDFISENGLSDPYNYSLLLEMMDMQSFIDWMCTNIYIANTDTQPFGSNVMVWQSTSDDGTGYDDGRFRWMLYDLDDALAVGSAYEGDDAYAFDSFGDSADYYSYGLIDDDPMPALMENEDFRRQFVITFMDMANENFNADRVDALLDEIESATASWASLSWSRWNTTWSYSSLYDQINDLRIFFENRFDAIVPLLAEYFELEGELVSLTLDTEGTVDTAVTLNTISPDLSMGGWTGYYYTDYTIVLTAEVPEGYEFEGWEVEGGTIIEGGTYSRTIEVRLEEDTHITAAFVESD